jgi:hypothetical protein
MAGKQRDYVTAALLSSFLGGLGKDAGGQALKR